jgi:hypothetical protein
VLFRSRLRGSETDIDVKIDASLVMESKVDSIRGRMMGTWEKINAAAKELEKALAEQPGRIGDLRGTIAVIELKIRKAEELMKQLNEPGK